jgi:hypothetical protein
LKSKTNQLFKNKIYIITHHISNHSGIEIEARLENMLENENETEEVIENSLNALARTHFKLDMTRKGLFEAARVRLNP